MCLRIVLSIYEFSAADNICRTAPPSSVQVSPLPQQSSLQRMTLRSVFRWNTNHLVYAIPLYHSAQLLLMLTGRAESAQITRRQEMSM